MAKFDPVSLEIMWSRLVNITEEMWTTTLRTAVSTIIASANDFGCEILDSRGLSIAHAVGMERRHEAVASLNLVR